MADDSYMTLVVLSGLSCLFLAAIAAGVYFLLWNHLARRRAEYSDCFQKVRGHAVDGGQVPGRRDGDGRKLACLVSVYGADDVRVLDLSEHEVAAAALSRFRFPEARRPADPEAKRPKRQSDYQEIAANPEGVSPMPSSHPPPGYDDDVDVDGDRNPPLPPKICNPEVDAARHDNYSKVLKPPRRKTKVASPVFICESSPDISSDCGQSSSLSASQNRKHVYDEFPPIVPPREMKIRSLCR